MNDKATPKIDMRMIITMQTVLIGSSIEYAQVLEE